MSSLSELIDKELDKGISVSIPIIKAKRKEDRDVDKQIREALHKFNNGVQNEE